MALHSHRLSRRRLAWIGGIAAGVLLAIAGVAALAGFFATDPVEMVAPTAPPRDLGVLYLSGDMGLRFGPNPHTPRALAAAGLPVVAVSTPGLFGTQRTLAEVERIIADRVADALVRTHRQRLVLVGQSYGADVLQTGLAGLPAALRAHVAGVVLIVPGRTVFFRADPSGIAYRGTPDSLAARTLARLTWTPLTCIYGRQETDSACPALHQPHAQVIAMPGGHFLDDDYDALAAAVMAAIRRDAPDAFATARGRA
ncbi:AcvB/VirJ family lysyl-phosphatidylglycerol hydrolase [Sphingomonas sp. CLY1604]|uniref:AcvB/VirJ family lysyl-phosphatidylglycerol hydrolase n=1 Tax=Sphingomonas sp. CLY1604 TaxID=3457786 RepID=UPI003FD7A5AE